MAEKGTEEIITGNFPNLARDINPHMKEAEQTPQRINPTKSMPRHTRIKLLKIKDKNS